MSSTIDSNPREAVQLSKFGLGAIALGFLLAFVLPLTEGGESYFHVGENLKIFVLSTIMKGLFMPNSLVTPLIGCLLMAGGFFIIAKKSNGAHVACYTAFIGAMLPALLFFMIYQGGNDPDGLMMDLMRELVSGLGGESAILVILAVFPVSFVMMAIGFLSIGSRTFVKANPFGALGMFILAMSFVMTMIGFDKMYSSMGQDDSLFETGRIFTWIGIIFTLLGPVLSIILDGKVKQYSALTPPPPPIAPNRQPTAPQTPSNDGYMSWRDARPTHNYTPESSWRKPDSDVTVSHDELCRSESDDRTSESLFVILRNPSLHTRTELENAAMALYNRRDPLYLSAFRTMDRDALRAIADNPSAHLRAEVFIAGDILAGRL